MSGKAVDQTADSGSMISHWRKKGRDEYEIGERKMLKREGRKEGKEGVEGWWGV